MEQLNAEIKEQLKQYMGMLEADVVLAINQTADENGTKVKALVEEIAALSPRISVETCTTVKAPGFSISKKGEKSRVSFAGLPLGHEFTSLVMALLQVSGRAPKVDAKVIKRINEINTPMHFETYVSLTCHNCPEVVQAFNIISALNPNVSHTMIEGGWFQDEIIAKSIMGVPTVFKGGDIFANGRMEIEDILNRILGEANSADFDEKEVFDVLVVGGGPAGASAAIYAARKGIRTGMLAERFGGQPLDTMGIENLIGTPYTEGPQLVAQLDTHVNEYDVDVMKATKAVKLERSDLVEITLSNGATLKSKTVVLATGARWRDLNVPGEEKFKAKGIAYCPHCDGPLFKGKNIAVIGGGNSGIEAAIDLAGLVAHVTVVEFADRLVADTVLQEKLKSLLNVDVILNAQTTEITGTDRVQGLSYTDRVTNEEKTLDVEGIFILIGLIPNTDWLKTSTVNMDQRGQILVDGHGATNIEGVYAAGDCTDSVYKQIIISMGSGATAALGAFDYLIRH
ncbi:MAG: alkyl hydroperoxide reductase subunit F [Defluviitaleaceae bacterium]|nr:alkyl hydroperoxide reductase subunit F [Defluviitaleaceae bacterium]